MEQTAVYGGKQLGDGKLWNATSCKSISWSPALADNRDVLEHCYAAKQPLVNSFQGMYKEHVEIGMLKQRPMLDITGTKWCQVQAHVNKVKSHFIQSAREYIAKLHDLHYFESAPELVLAMGPGNLPAVRV